jgi:hypothetical protein
MNSVLNKIRLIKTTKLNKYHDSKFAWPGAYPDLPYPRNGCSCKLLTERLKGPHEEVMWVASSLRVLVLNLVLDDGQCPETL